MNTSGTPPPLWIFALFPVFFVGLWVVIGTLLSRLSGWSTLAGHFRADNPPSGTRFRFVSGSMGKGIVPVQYRSCLFVTVNDRGLHLSLLPPFRFMSPALFIPWTKVESVEERQFLMVHWTVLRLRNLWPVISLRGRAGEAVREAHARAIPGGKTS
jgi:hypothetical protein